MFKVDELIEAAQARLISGKISTTLCSISIDSRTIRPGEAFIAIKGNNFDGHNFINEAIKKQAKAIIIQNSKFKIPTWPAGRQNSKDIAFIVVKDTIRALGDIAKFQREKFDIPVIAITGSNGKTTTKEMMAQVLSKKFKVLKNPGTKNNQIGLPLTLLSLKRCHDLVVLELGTNHPGEIEYLARIAQANIGIITNIGPSHLEYLRDLKGVFREKYTLLKHLKDPQIAILNADDSLLRRKVAKENKRPFILGFGIKQRSDFSATQIKILNERIEFLVNQKYRFTPLDRRIRIDDAHRHLTGFTLKTLGYFNIYNALATIAVARVLGMEYQDIVEGLANFNFLGGRLNLRELNNIKFIDDTYNSNPLSLKQALDVLERFPVKGRKIFVMGDMLELGSQQERLHRQAGRKITQICDVFITVGELSKFAAEAARLSGFDDKNIFICETCNEARDILFNTISPGEDDIILIKGSRAMMMEEIFK